MKEEDENEADHEGPAKKDGKSGKKSGKGDDNKGGKKKKVEAADEVEALMNLSIADKATAQPWPSREKKFVYKAIYEVTQAKGKDMVNVNELWKYIEGMSEEAKKGVNIKSLKEMMDIVLLLDFESKVMYADKENAVVLI